MAGERAIKNSMKKLVIKTEQQQHSLGVILMSVVAIAILRNLVEIGWKKGDVYPMPSDVLTGMKMLFFHFTFYWLDIYLLLSLVLYIFTKRQGNTIESSLNIALLAFPIIICPPIIDLFLGNKEHIGYPDNPAEVFQKIGGFLSNSTLIGGITIGMRYEIAFVSLAAVWYVFFKTGQWFKSLVAGIIIFMTILCTGLWPASLSIFYETYFSGTEYTKLSNSTLLQMGSILERSTHKISVLYIGVFVLLLAVVKYIQSPKTLKSLVANMRATRSLHYLILYTGGVLLALKITVTDGNYLYFLNHPFDWIGLLAGATVIFSAFQGAVLLNDIYDLEIDKISNNIRPLVTGEIQPLGAKWYSLFFISISLVLAICLDESTFILTLAFHALSFLYSCPPFRLRQLPGIPNVILGLVALLCFHIGSSLITDNDTFEKIPQSFSWAVLWGYSIATTIKDLKDYEGDKENGVLTLMTWLGKYNGRIVTGMLIFALALSLPAIFGVFSMMWIAIPCAISLFWVIYKKQKEVYIFAIYYIYMTVFVYHIFTSTNKIY